MQAKLSLFAANLSLWVSQVNRKAIHAAKRSYRLAVFILNTQTDIKQ